MILNQKMISEEFKAERAEIKRINGERRSIWEEQFNIRQIEMRSAHFAFMKEIGMPKKFYSTSSLWESDDMMRTILDTSYRIIEIDVIE